MKRCMIISGGSVDRNTASVFLNEYQYDVLIAADHGMDAAKDLGLVPDFIVGDFDSVNHEAYDYYKEIPGISWDRHPCEKDETDTELAFMIAIEENCDEIHLFGATGSRMDHTLGAIALLQIPMEKGVRCFSIDSNNRMTMIKDEYRMTRKNSPYKYLSLIPYSEEVTGVTARGVKYPLDRYTMTQGNTLGVSNEITGDEAVITIEKGKLIVIESKD